MSLENLKTQVEDAKAKKAELEGGIKEHMKRLKKDYAVDSVEAAQKKLVKLNKEYDKLSNEIEKEYAALKTMMDEIE
jgi:predicted  nucleic acid-binding Zn-ribbon protein